MDNVKCISWWPNNHSKTEGVAQRKEQNGGSSSLVVLMAEQVSKYWNSLGSFSQKKKLYRFPRNFVFRRNKIFYLEYSRFALCYRKNYRNILKFTGQCDQLAVSCYANRHPIRFYRRRPGLCSVRFDRDWVIRQLMKQTKLRKNTRSHDLTHLLRSRKPPLVDPIRRGFTSAEHRLGCLVWWFIHDLCYR